MNRATCAVLLPIIFLAAFAVPVQADTAVATVSADEVKYDYETKQVEAFGNVRIIYKNIRIESDQALIDQEQNILLATGNVKVKNKNNEYHGDKFLYYLKLEQGWISPLAAVITDPEITGPVQMTATEAFIKGEEIRSKYSSFSSCNLAEPHYHLTAKEIEYYPEDRIVMHHVWYWEQKIRLFYLPLLYISLKKSNLEVDAGQSAIEGWFLDVKYWYYPSDYTWGDIHTRVTEYGGDLLGVTQNQWTSPTGQFTQDYEILDKENMGIPFDDYKVGFGYSENINPKWQTKQSIYNWHHFNNEGQCYLESGYLLNLTGQSPYPSLSFSIKDLDTDQYIESSVGREIFRPYRDIYVAPSWNYNFDQTASFNLNGQWYYQGYLDEINKPNINYNLNATKNWGWSNVSAQVAVAQINTKNTDSSFNFSSSNIQPDIIYTIPKWDLPLIGQVMIKSQYTYLEKFNNSPYSVITDEKGERYALDIEQKPIDLWKQGQITLDTNGDFLYRDIFENRDENELYALSGQFGLTDQFTKEFHTKFDLGYAQTVGTRSTFFNYAGDSLQPGANLSNGWYWNSKTLNASLYTMYYFYTKQAEPVNITADWIPVPQKQEINFNTIYDWDKGFGITNLNVIDNPNDNLRLKLFLGYDFSNLSWTMQEFEADIKQQLSAKWRMELSTYYSFVAQQFTRSDVSLFYDWHCREVLFHYDGVNKMYWLQIIIKAFPSAKLQLGGGANPLEYLFNEI